MLLWRQPECPLIPRGSFRQSKLQQGQHKPRECHGLTLARLCGWMRCVTRQQIKHGHRGFHLTHSKQQLGKLSAASGEQIHKERGCTSLPALAESPGPHLSVLTSKGKSVASSSHRLSEEQGKFCRPTNLYWKSKRGLEEATLWSTGEQVAALVWRQLKRKDSSGAGCGIRGKG